MKVLTTKMEIPITWTFAGEKPVLRSNVIAGYQAEVYKNILMICTSGGRIVHYSSVKSRRDGMKRATKLLSKAVLSLADHHVTALKQLSHDPFYSTLRD